MKFTNTDYIVLFNIIVLLIILGYLVYKLEYESGIFVRNNILINTCKYVNDKSNPNYLFYKKLNNKLHVKDFNDKYFPDMKYAKTLHIFEKPDYLYQIQYQLPDKYVVKYSSGWAMNLVKEENTPIKDIVNECTELIKRPDPDLDDPSIVSALKPKFFVEEYLGKELIDYKFLMIYGKIVAVQIMGNRFGDISGIEKGSEKALKSGHDIYYTQYDENGQLLPDSYLSRKFIIKEKPYPLPKNFDKMKEICYQFYDITKIELFRVDFYEIEGELYFGEYTIYPADCEFPISKQVERHIKNKINKNNNNI